MEIPSSLPQYLQALPKAELHIHLEAIEEIILNGIRWSFLPEKRRLELLSGQNH